MKILFITSSFFPKADANGICVYNVAKEYVQAGHKVYCIANRTEGLDAYEQIDGIDIYRVKSAWFSRFYNKYSTGGLVSKLFCKAVHIVRNLCLIFAYPNVAPFRAKKVYRLAQKLCKEKKIDVVFGAYRPYESIYTLHRLKKEYGSRVKCAAYYLDILYENKNIPVGKCIYDKRIVNAHRKDLRLLDGVFLPENYVQEFREKYGESKKLEGFDFPLYEQSAEIKDFSVPFAPENINLAYIGSLDAYNRNPENMLRLLRKISRTDIPVKLHIWGNVLGVEHILDDYKDIVLYHGYVEHQYVNSVFAQADFLVNIANKVHKDMIPSKIFQLFAAGKPIVNFLCQEDDKSLPYFEKYGNTFFVRQWEWEQPEQINALIDFLNTPAAQVVADKCFEKNTPQYVAKKMISRMIDNEN